MKREGGPVRVITIPFKEYERLLGIEKAWKRLRRWMSEDGYFYFGRKGTVRIRTKMTKIRKQCTKPQKREDKVVEKEKKQKSATHGADFSISKMVAGINSALKEQGIEGELKEVKREGR